MHKLLDRQVRRHLGDANLQTPAMKAFLDAVETAYVENDADRALLERSLELTSQELTQRYAVLRRQERELQTILDSVPAHIVFKDTEGRILRLNRQLAQIMGHTVAEIEGHLTTEFFPEQAEQYLRDDQEVIQSGVAKLGVVEPMTDGAGEKRWLRTDKMPYRDEDGNVVGIIVFAIDITAQKEAEERLKGAYDQLKDLDRFRTQFLNNAAHELGTPLTPIKLQIHLLKNQPELFSHPDEKKSIDILDRSVERLGQLVNDVLDAARLQAGRLKLNQEPVRLEQVVTESVESFREQARRSQVSLELGRVEPFTVVGDQRRLVQVMFNLLTNAFKFTPEGGRVIVDAYRHDGGALVRVEDTGIGLRPEDIPRLFQAFSQVHDTMQRTRGGTGLGLYISRGIIEDLGGHIWVESPGPGRGSVFAFWVPSGTLPKVPATFDAVPLPDVRPA